MKKLILLFLLLSFQNLTYAQDIISNGDFEDYGGGLMTMDNLVDWDYDGIVDVGGGFFYENNYPVLQDVPFDNHDNDGKIIQQVEILEGVDYTFNMDFANGSPIADNPFSFTTITVSLVSFSPLDVETLLTIDTESLTGWPINFSNIGTSFTPGQDYEYLYFSVDGFDWLELPNADIGSLEMITVIDNVSITWESPDGPNFHFENSRGIETDVFCDGETVMMNAEASENVESYYIDALRRPLSGGPTAEYSWFGSLGTTTDSEIGTLNLSSLFANAGMPFVTGYEYKIKLAISNDMSSWWENSHEFIYAEDPVPTFVFENESGNVENKFCAGEVIYLDGTGSQHEEKHRLSISERSSGSNDSFVWKGQTEWLDGTVGEINLTDLFSNLGHQFLLGFEYKVQLIVGNVCDPWDDFVDYFDVISAPIPTFHFVDSGENSTTQFCLEEEVILDGSDSKFEERYRISIYERPIGSTGNFSWRGLTSWIDGEIDQVNLDNVYEGFGYQFLGNHEYQIRLILGNKCDEWEMKQKTFQMLEDCCFAPQNLSCSYHSGSNYLNWDPVPMATSYIVEITYNNCCNSSLPVYTTQFLVKKETSLQAPDGFFDCFSWRVIAECGHNLFYSEWSCYTTKYACPSAEFNEDADQFRVANANDFKIYPNPTRDIINISISDDFEDGIILLMDAMGRVLSKTDVTNTMIDTTPYPAGIYFVLFQAEDEIIYKERVVVIK